MFRLALALAPGDVARTVSVAGEDVDIETGSDRLVAQIFKTRIDPFVSKMSFIRVFSGTLKKDSSVQVSRIGKPVKIGQLLSVNGAEQENIDLAVAGQIVALVKMEDLNANDMDAAVKMIEGTCRSMGVNVVETGGGPTPVEPADESDGDDAAASSGESSKEAAEGDAAADDSSGEPSEEAAEGEAAEE